MFLFLLSITHNILRFLSYSKGGYGFLSAEYILVSFFFSFFPVQYQNRLVSIDCATFRGHRCLLDGVERLPNYQLAYKTIIWSFSKDFNVQTILKSEFSSAWIIWPCHRRCLFGNFSMAGATPHRSWTSSIRLWLRRFTPLTRYIAASHRSFFFIVSEYSET